MKTPHPDEVLTVNDIDSEELPNGTSTVLTVIDPQGKPLETALIDDAGYVRQTGTGQYIAKENSVRARG